MFLLLWKFNRCFLICLVKSTLFFVEKSEKLNKLFVQLFFKSKQTFSNSIFRRRNLNKMIKCWLIFCSIGIVLFRNSGADIDSLDFVEAKNASSIPSFPDEKETIISQMPSNSDVIIPIVLDEEAAAEVVKNPSRELSSNQKNGRYFVVVERLLKDSNNICIFYRHIRLRRGC